MAHSRSSRVMEGLLTRSLSNHSPLPTFQLVTFPDTSRSSYVRSEFIKCFNNLFSPLTPVYLRQHNVDLNLYAGSFCNILKEFFDTSLLFLNNKFSQQGGAVAVPPGIQLHCPHCRRRILPPFVIYDR